MPISSMLRPNQPFEDPSGPALPFRWAAAVLVALVPFPVAFAFLLFVGEALFKLCPRGQLDSYRCTAPWFEPTSSALASLVIAATGYFFVALPTWLAPGSKALVARSVSFLGIAFYLFLFATGTASTIWPFAVWVISCAAAAYYLSRRHTHAA